MKSTYLSIILLFVLQASLVGQDEIAIAKIDRTDQVDFDREILPMLRQNCLACHNSTDAEGDVVLETVAKIIESEAVVAGKPDESSLLTLSAHKDDPVMPPEDNEVKAKNMTSEQLGLLQLWIAQGAKPSVNSTANKVEFAALPPGVNPVYALAMSPNGQFLAAGRANQIFVYRVPSKRLVDRVTDPELVKASPYKKKGVAHLDIVQSLAFSPDNRTFVSGGFRNVKVWRRNPVEKSKSPLTLEHPIQSFAVSNQKGRIAFGGDKGEVTLWDSSTGKNQPSFKVGDAAVDLIAVTEDGKQVATITGKRKLKLTESPEGKLVGSELELPQDAISLTFLANNQKLAVGLANNSIAVYSMETLKADAKEKREPEKLLNGHGKPARLLNAYGENDSKLISGSEDGTAKIWNLANGQQIKSFAHGSPVSHVEISDDESRVATCSPNGTLKIFNATNSALVKEVTGDVSVDEQNQINARDVKLKQQLIAVAKADLDNGNKEKAAEEANVKKTEEALKKADEELKKKLEAKTKADEAWANGNKPLEMKKAELAKVQDGLKNVSAMVVKSMEEVKTLAAEAKMKTDLLNKANADLQKAEMSLAVAKTALDKDQGNADLKTKFQAAEKAVAENKSAVAELVKQQKLATTKQKEAESALAKSNQAKTELDKQLAAIDAEIKKLEPNVKKLADAQKKALDEHTAASRNQTLAKNSVERAKARAKKAVDRIPGLEQVHQAAEKSKEEAEKLATEFSSANASKLANLVAIVSMGDRQLGYLDASGNLGICDWESGEKLDSFAVPEFAGSPFLISQDDRILSFAKDGKSVSSASVSQGWSWVRTIGGIDDTKSLTDRVTALDISPDGKLLATGAGEPSRSGQVKIWNLENGELVREIQDAHSDTILDLKFSPDGTMLATSSSDRFMKTFNLADGKMIRVFEGHTHHVMSVDWNSTGRDLTTAGADKVVKIWDANTGTQKRTIAGYGKEVTALCFLELSNNVVTASGDKTVRIKRTDNGGEVRSLSGNTDFVYTVTATADGKRIAAGGEDSIIRVWNDNGQLHAEFKPPSEGTSNVSATKKP